MSQFLGCYFHQNYGFDYASVEDALDAALREWPLDGLKAVATEWWDWNASVGAQDDIRKEVQSGMGVALYFKTPIDGRKFMNRIYDRLVETIRTQTGTRWKP